MNIIRCERARPLSAWYRVLNSGRGNYISRRFIRRPTLRARERRRREEGERKKKEENKNRKRHKINSRRINERRYSHLPLGRENSRRNEKFKRVAARLSSRSGGWQISAIPARYQLARFPTIDNLSAREIRRRRREFIVHRRSRGLVKVRLYNIMRGIGKARMSRFLHCNNQERIKSLCNYLWTLMVTFVLIALLNS